MFKIIARCRSFFARAPVPRKAARARASFAKKYPFYMAEETAAFLLKLSRKNLAGRRAWKELFNNLRAQPTPTSFAPTDFLP